MTFSRKTILVFVLVLFVLNFFAWQEVFRLNQRTFKVYFFDVGQGDSILIETSKGQLVLIDGGKPNTGIIEKLSEILPFFKRKIDLVVVTHPHLDHFGGLTEVLEKYNVENILWTGIKRENELYQEFERKVKEGNAEIHIAKKGQEVLILPEKRLKTLYPFEDISGKEFPEREVNETSIVSMLVYRDNRFLFTGDICKEVEREMIERGVDLKSNVLKVAHHGSRHSTSKEFLKENSPQLAVIQVGENNYGHPHEELLSRLDEFGIKALITKNDGDIEIISVGNKLLINK